MAAARAMPRPPELALVDLGLPPHPHRPDEGFALVGDLLALSPSMRIIILSGQSEETNARHARALGATEFVAKPADPEALRQALTRALSFRAAELSPTAESGDAFVGDSPPVRKLREQVRQYADSPFPVLIEGESGSGKEIVAQAFLHQALELKTTADVTTTQGTTATVQPQTSTSGDLAAKFDAAHREKLLLALDNTLD